MPSVLGLLEAREKGVREENARLREEAERVRAVLGEAERALERLVDARATLAEPPSAVAEPQRGSVEGSPVPHRSDGMAASVLAPDCQRIVSVPESVGGLCRGGRGLCTALAVPAGSDAPGRRPTRWPLARGRPIRAPRMVERTLSRLMRSRRLVRDYETLPAMYEATALWSMTVLMNAIPRDPASRTGESNRILWPT
ncbi:hypothetical protein [Streptomyces sp. NL15-2K]|uniref:hypothetical protein n=1 Tax=Streptomyces sp. NL15-2K TaxID=376149 RepID=UPI000FFA3E87|nr:MULTISPECIES: hypothetical protein [Actinomycetes]WKX06186.1 hypothetical protein Q4V64_01260 [Kutzneria buriramensis]GCB52961.1 hypothetical protein SNL152K_10318 [Streptomyces sp. NL15-2K]